MPSSELWRNKKHCLIASALSFVAGYTDAICATRWHAFATMMTGNVLFVGRSTVHWQSQYLTSQAPEDFTGPWYYALILLTFCCGVVAWRLAEHRYPDRGASTVGIPFAFLMVAMELVLICSPWVREYPMTYSLTVLAYAPMFGVMNAACQAGRLATTTTAATGHIVTVITVTVKGFCLRQELSKAEQLKRRMGLIVIGSTVIGVMVGVVVYLLRSEGSHGALMPIGPTLAALFWLHDHLAKPSSLVKKAQALQRKVAAKKVDFRRRAAPSIYGDDSDESDLESSPSDSDCSDESDLSPMEAAPWSLMDDVEQRAMAGAVPSSTVAARGSPNDDLEQCAIAGASPSSVPATLLTPVPRSSQMHSEEKKPAPQALRPKSFP